MSHVSQYGLLGFVQALELVFTQAIQFVLGLGLIVLGWVLCRKFGTPVPSAVSRQVRNSSINDDSPSRHDQSPLEGSMSDYNSSALIAFQEKLKTNIAMKPHLINMLEKQAGGFMTRAEAQSVRNAEDPMGRLTEIILGKGDKEFNTFCDMLEKSNHRGWADRLRLEAKMNRQKEDQKAVVAFVHPAYDVKETNGHYLEKAIMTVAKNKKLDQLRLKKDLYRHTYVSVEHILEANAQHFRHMVRAAELANEDEEDARALTTTRTVAELLDRLQIKTKWEDTELLTKIVLSLPEEPRTLAMSLLKQYDGYLEVYDDVVPAQDSLQMQPVVPEGTKPQVPVEITVRKRLDEFMNNDCKDIVNLLLHHSYQIPRIESTVAAIEPGSTTVVFLIDKAFTENIVHSSCKVSSLWAYEELSVTRVRVGDFELNVIQLLTQHFKEALRSGLTGGMDFVHATKALPYQVYALVDPDISEQLIIQTVNRKVAEPCPEQEESVSDSTADEEVEPITEQISQTSLVSRLQEALEAANRGSNFGVQGKPEEGGNYVIYSRLYSELEDGISLNFRSQAVKVKDIKVHVDSWLREKEDEFAQLETKHNNQTTLANIRRLLRKLEDYLHTIQTMVRQTDTLLDISRELHTGRPELMGIFELAVVAVEPVFESGRPPNVQDVKEETAELKRRYEELKKRVSRSYSRMKLLLDAECILMDDQRRLVDATKRLYSQRQEGREQMRKAAPEVDDIIQAVLTLFKFAMGIVGACVAGTLVLGTGGLALPLAVAAAAVLVDSTGRLYSQRQHGREQMEIAADELDANFQWLIATTILMTLGFSAVGAVTLSLATVVAGLVATVALGGAALAGGGAAGATYIQKKMKESELLTAANDWILEEDRPVCKKLLNIIDSFETHLNEMLANFPDREAMDTHFKQNGIDVEKLQKCFNELLEVSRRWRDYGFGSHSEAGIKRAEDVVRTYLNKNEYDRKYLSAVTLFLDLKEIGDIGYDVAYLKKAKPPIRKLLRIIAEGLLKDAAPAARLAEQPWRIRDQQSAVHT